LRSTSSFRWDLLLKVGGSLGRSGALRPLLQRIALLAHRRRLLVVPGGGEFADLVRGQTTRLRIDEKTAHHMALLAMDQYGLLLSSLSRRATGVDNLRAAELVAEAGRVPILLTASLVQREPGLERSFRLTSDSIAAFLAGRLHSTHLILLKSVRKQAERIRDRASAEALARRGVVDPLFPEMMPARTTAWILCGRRPQDLDRFMPVVSRTAARGRRAGPRSSTAPRPRPQGLRGTT
jgi:5-(aminomethyl)-3-furanmethanol phosphate kinase